MQQHWLKPVLANARSCLDQAAAIVRGNPWTTRAAGTVSGDAVALEAVFQSLVTYARRELPRGGNNIFLNAAEATSRHGLLVTVRFRRQSGARTGTTERGHRRDRIGLSMAMRFAQAKGGELHVDRPDGDQLVITMQVPALRSRPS